MLEKFVDANCVTTWSLLCKYLGHLVDRALDCGALCRQSRVL